MTCSKVSQYEKNADTDNSNSKSQDMDPLSIMTVVATGLKLVDQFRDMVLKFRGAKVTPPSGKVEKKGSEIEISVHNQVNATVKTSDIKMDQWDSVRYNGLNKRIDANWKIFNSLYADLPTMSAHEKAKTQVTMETLQEELCKDFKEMVGIYERVLGENLPDHYKLYEVCV